MKKNWKIAEKSCFTKSVGAGAKCDHLGVRTRVRAHLNLDGRGACVRPKKGRNSHLEFNTALDKVGFD